MDIARIINCKGVKRYKKKKNGDFLSNFGGDGGRFLLKRLI